MNAVTIVFWIVVAAIVLAVATPQGRTALKSIVNSLGTMFNRGARKLETAERLNEAVKTQVQAQTAKDLAEAQAAYADTTRVIEAHEEDLKALRTWEQNLATATAKFQALTSDDVSDAEQREAAIGAVRTAGEQALAAIAELKAAIAANEATYNAARQTRHEAEQLFASLPADARRAIREGDAAAAAILVDQVSARVAETKAGAETNPAATTLSKLARMKADASARRKAAEARMAAMPMTADQVAFQLENVGKPSSFDAHVAAQATQNESAN